MGLRLFSGAPSYEAGWTALKIGGGGYSTSGDIAPDGTMVIRTDCYGAYRWDSDLDKWVQLVTRTSIPYLNFPNLSTGVWEIRIAPSNSNIFYMWWQGYLWRTINKGTRWERTNFPRGGAYAELSPNNGFKTHCAKIGIDPNNPNIVITGKPGDNCKITTDGGETWTNLPTVAVAASDTSGYRVFFIDSSNILVHSAGNGTYASSNGGSSFTLTTSGPTTDLHDLRAATDGICYGIESDVSSGLPVTNKFWKYNAGTWTNPSITTSGNRLHVIVPDPANAARLVSVGWDGTLCVSTNRGTSWTANYSPVSRTASGDVTWHAATLEDYMSAGNAFIDPVSGDLFFTQGIGFWRTTVPGSAGALTWRAQSRGIESLVVNEIVAPLGLSAPIVACWDRPLFRPTGTYPTFHGPNYDNAIQYGWALDWASSDPTFVAALCNGGSGEASCYSTDGGLTWTPFASMPPFVSQGDAGGSIAVSTPSNIVVVGSNNGYPYYTTNGGALWTRCTIPNEPGGGTSGWGNSQNDNRKIVCADRVTANKFYLYNSETGMYVSTDGGATWTELGVTNITTHDGFHVSIKSVPGHAGHILYASGSQGDPETSEHPATGENFKVSTDSGATWSNFGGVVEPLCFGFGKAAPAQSEPTVFVVGWIGGVYGYYYRAYDGSTWTKFGDYPLNTLDVVRFISGDMNTYGKCYVGFGGSGCAVYTLPT